MVVVAWGSTAPPLALPVDIGYAAILPATGPVNQREAQQRSRGRHSALPATMSAQHDLLHVAHEVVMNKMSSQRVRWVALVVVAFKPAGGSCVHLRAMCSLCGGVAVDVADGVPVEVLATG